MAPWGPYYFHTYFGLRAMSHLWWRSDFYFSIEDFLVSTKYEFIFSIFHHEPDIVLACKASAACGSVRVDRNWKPNVFFRCCLSLICHHGETFGLDIFWTNMSKSNVSRRRWECKSFNCFDMKIVTPCYAKVADSFSRLPLSGFQSWSSHTPYLMGKWKLYSYQWALSNMEEIDPHVLCFGQINHDNSGVVGGHDWKLS